jgi:hypothetical protein
MVEFIMGSFENFVDLVKTEFESEFQSIAKAPEEPAWFDEAVKSKYGMYCLLEEICDRVVASQLGLVLGAISESPERFLEQDLSDCSPQNLNDALRSAFCKATIDDLEEYLDDRFYGQLSNLSASDVSSEVFGIIERLEAGVGKQWDSIGRKLDLEGKLNQSQNRGLEIFCQQLSSLKSSMSDIVERGWDLEAASRMETLSWLVEAYKGYSRQEGDEELLSRLNDLSGYICHCGDEVFAGSVTLKV